VYETGVVHKLIAITGWCKYIDWEKNPDHVYKLIEKGGCCTVIDCKIRIL